MSKIEIISATIVNNVPTVNGTINGEAFTAGPFRWGQKMLMKVSACTIPLTMGQKVAIGHASKKALRLASIFLPVAVLVRPRAVKEVAVEVKKSTIDFEKLTVPALRALAKLRGLKGYSDQKKEVLVSRLAA